MIKQRLLVAEPERLSPQQLTALEKEFALSSPHDERDFSLSQVDHYWTLTDTNLGISIHADFVTGASAHRRRFGGGRGQAIARACGLKSGKTPTIIDATAGLGRDAFVLASLGCQVHLIERSAAVAVLLGDAIERARSDAETREIAERMHLHHADAREALMSMQTETGADVVYLDPMFPERRKSAAVKKEMRCFQGLVGEDLDAGDLLDSALQCGAKRIAVKRPSKAEALAGRTPDAQVAGKTTRYDLYFKP
ncbi:MAG: class I SAM-dependent methyltransferase [Gammaproteobacteria bacterium]